MYDFEKLKSPFPADQIKWRVGNTTVDKSRGTALAYVDARAVMDRLDEVLGPENWQDSYSELGGTMVCKISVYFKEEGLWVSKSDGTGLQDANFEVHKAALSDAFKRAAVKWGVSRYLYAIEAPWVDVDKGKFIARNELPRLRKLLEAKGAAASARDVPLPETISGFVERCKDPDKLAEAMLKMQEHVAEGNLEDDDIGRLCAQFVAAIATCTSDDQQVTDIRSLAEAIIVGNNKRQTAYAKEVGGLEAASSVEQAAEVF
jgi:hypothetical protein